MSRALVCTALALLALSTTACSRTRARPVSPGQARPLPSAPLCQIQDRWTHGDLRAPRGGFVFASIAGGEAQAALERTDGALRVRVFVRRGGWWLHGRLDPAEGDGLRARSALQLGEGVWASAGTAVSILDARPGAIAVGMHRHAPDAENGVRFIAPVGAWVPCTALGLSSTRRDERAYREERRALGLPPEPPEVLVAAGARAQLSSVPGGPPFAELAPSEHGLMLHVVEERVPYARVLLHHWTGTMILGWVGVDSLSAPEGGSMGGLGIGGIGGPTTLRVCTSPERLTIAASQGDGSAEPVGTVEPGTRLVLLGAATEPGAVIRLRPHPADGVRIEGRDVWWTAQPSAPLTCVDETDDLAAGFARALAAAPTYTVRATVTASSGAAAPAVGSECTAQLHHFPAAHYPCRIEVRCGERIVYGHRLTNGAFDCELLPDVPSVRGRDEETSAASGDGAMSIDTGQRSLVIDDDPEGPNGELRIEARIDSFERASR